MIVLNPELRATSS